MRERFSERIDVVAIVHEAMPAGLLAALIAVALATASAVRADVSTAVSGSTLIVTVTTVRIGSKSNPPRWG
jgi:hypothetical protein